MLKIRIEELPDPGDKMHVRHLHQALRNCPLADVRDDAEDPAGDRDFTFTVSPGYRPPSGKTVYRPACDPQDLAHCFDIESMWSQDLLELAYSHGVPRDFHTKELEHYRRRWTGQPFTETLDSFDVIGAMFYAPYVTQLPAQLKHARVVYMPHCVPEWIFNASLDEQKTVDVFWVGACTREHYPLRAEIILGLSGGTVPGVSYEIHPYGMKCSDPLPGDCDQMRDRGWTLERLDAHQREYAARLRASKILAMDQSVYNGFVSKTFEAMACGCLVLSPLPHSAGPLGLVDGVNIVAIDSSNWRDKLRYYAEHDNERMEIVRRAYEHVHANHTCGARAAAIVRDLEALA